jgi:hypothetical protein
MLNGITAKSKWSTLGLILTLPTIPLYLLPSGMPQLFHGLVVLLCLINVIFFVSVSSQNNIKNPIGLFESTLLIFIAYVFLQSTLYFLISHEERFFLGAMYFSFSFTVFWVYRCIFSRVEVGAIYIAVVLTFSVSLFGVFWNGFSLYSGAYAGRSLGFFNNPNQLGFFSVLIYSFLAVLYDQKLCSRLMLFPLLLLVFFSAMVSLSKAALVAMLVGMAALFFRFSYLALALVLVLVLVFSVTWVGDFDELLAFQRLERGFDEGDSSLAARGYFVIKEFDWMYAFFGVGEPEVVKILGHEVHSIYASIWTNYGIVGGGLFAVVGLFFFRELTFSFGVYKSLIYLLPIALYGVTHNGLRFSLLWVFIAFIITLARSKRLR